MKELYYTLSNFHKAVKRNNPETVYYDNNSNEFWFFTQKAIINYTANNSREFTLLMEWLNNNGVDVESFKWCFAV